MELSPKVKLIIEDAKNVASSLEHSPSLEHLFICVFNSRSGLAGQSLNRYAPQSDFLLPKISEFLEGNPPKFGVDGKLEETVSFKKAIKEAENFASSFQSSYVSVDHLLLAILKQDNHPFISFLKSANVQVTELVAALMSKTAKKIEINQDSDSELTLSDGSSESGNSQKSEVGKYIYKFAINLNAKLAKSPNEKFVGRKREVERLISILSRKTKNCPVLVGEAGVGKTAIVELFASLINSREVPAKFLDSQVYVLDVALLVAGTKYRGQFEERIKKIMEEAQDPSVILFIDEIHTIMGAGGENGDIANFIKPALARGEIRLIGATTFEEYRKHIERDAALDRRMQKVDVEEPTQEETLEIVMGAKCSFESHHGVVYPESTVKEAVRLAAIYMRDRKFPDKVFDILDESPNIGILKPRDSDALMDLKSRLRKIRRKISDAEKCQKYNLFSDLSRERDEIEEKISNFPEGEAVVFEVPPEAILPTVKRISNLEKHNGTVEREISESDFSNVVGQGEAVKKILEINSLKSRGIFPRKGVAASFLLVGSESCGKKLIAETFAKKTFGERAFFGLDMTLFATKESINTLIGAPSAYVGYEDGGLLINKVRSMKRGVLFLENFDAAHAEIKEMFSKILDEGKMSDLSGRVADFSEIFVFATVKIAKYKRSMIFGPETQERSHNVPSSISEKFDLEIFCNELSEKDYFEIARRLSADLEIRLLHEKISVKIEDSAIEFLVGKIDKNSGVKSLEKNFNEFLTKRFFEVTAGESFRVFYENGKNCLTFGP